MCSAERPVVLCAGVAVQDLIFRVERFPQPGEKTGATEFRSIGGGCAANAAIAVMRLGGVARFSGPLGGPPGADPVTEAILAGLAREGVDTGGVVRVEGATAPVSGILVDAAGERMIATHRDPRLRAARPPNLAALLDGVNVLLVDNVFPDFVLPLCAAARERGIPVVLDADRPRTADDPLFGCVSHAVFSRECLLGTVEGDDPATALPAMAKHLSAFLAVTDGANDVLWMDAGRVRRLPVPRVQAVDTLAAGDAFHGAFALALAEGHDAPEALRFAAAATALKCTRFGGIAGVPARAEVEALLATAG